MVQQVPTVNVLDEWLHCDILPKNTAKMVCVKPNMKTGQRYPKVVVTLDERVIKLDAGDYGGGLNVTTVSSCYSGTSAFAFSVRSGDWLKRFEKVQPRRTGRVLIDPKFDELASVLSSNPDKVRHLLNSGSIKKQISELGSCLLTMDYGSGGYVLSFADVGAQITVDNARLTQIFELVIDVLKLLDLQASAKNV